MVRHFRRHGSASSASGDASAKMNEVTGTFGVPLELCVPSTFSPVSTSVCHLVFTLVCVRRESVITVLQISRTVLLYIGTGSV